MVRYMMSIVVLVGRGTLRETKGVCEKGLANLALSKEF